MRFRFPLTIFISAGLAAAALGQTPASIQNTNNMKWGPAPSFLPKGAQLAVLSGNPMAAGPFVIRLKMPANYTVPAHWHTTDELLTIISGNFYGGMGDKVNKSKAMVVRPGGFVAMPAKMHHFAFSKGPCVVQINAMGPFDIHYLDPKTDPTKH